MGTADQTMPPLTTIERMITRTITFALLEEVLHHDISSGGAEESERCVFRRISCPLLQGCEDEHSMFLHSVLAMDAELVA